MPGDTQVDEAARLEAALLRIQAAADRRGRPADQAPNTAPGAAPANSQLASRLDALIAELRTLLAPPP